MSDKITIEMNGASDVNDLLLSMPSAIQKRARRTGMARAAGKYRTLLRKDAPRVTGLLRRAIQVKRHKNGSYSVGLKTLFYYKKLDFVYPSGGAYNPWFLDSVDRHKDTILAELVKKTEEAVYVEAGKTYRRSLTKIRR